MNKIITALFALGLVSCVYDKQHEIVTIRNESGKNIVAIVSQKSELNDDDLYYRSKYLISKDTTIVLTSLAVPDNRFFLFIFNADSVFDSMRKKIKISIVKKSFLTKYELSMDSLKAIKKPFSVFVFR